MNGEPRRRDGRERGNCSRRITILLKPYVYEEEEGWRKRERFKTSKRERVRGKKFYEGGGEKQDEGG